MCTEIHMHATHMYIHTCIQQDKELETLKKMWSEGEEDRAELLLRAQHVKQIDDLKARHAVSGTLSVLFALRVHVCMYLCSYVHMHTDQLRAGHCI